MPESQEQSGDMKLLRTGPGSSSNSHAKTSSFSHLNGSTAGEKHLQSSLDGQRPEHNHPDWLRPFFSLRVQLTLVYGMLLALIAVVLFLLSHQAWAPIYVVLAEVATVIAGTLIAFLFTSLLLRPLGRVTDAAQAIAIGDLEQRARLPLMRLPPQDEVDRLTGSLHEMVTRLEYAEDMQRQAEQRSQRFFVDASHQLRTPLTSIGGFTQVLMRGAKDDPETVQRILQLMKTEVERMTRLIADLLTLSRLEDEQRPPKMQLLDLSALASDGIAQARTQTHDGRTIELVLETHEMIGLQGDKDRLKKLLTILLDNAIKHGRPAPDGEVTLHLDKQQNQAIIRVIDNGEGIAREDLDHIFDAFYKGRPKRTAIANGASVGAGLGLTIAAGIVRVHHGTITVCSDPGAGTEFRVTLPTTQSL
jgi:two-component system OmpR family sensor kinase